MLVARALRLSPLGLCVSMGLVQVHFQSAESEADMLLRLAVVCPYARGFVCSSC